MYEYVYCGRNLNIAVSRLFSSMISRISSMDGFNYLCDRYPAFLLIIFGAYASLNEVEDSPIFDQADALREYSTIKYTEKKDSRSALLSSRRFLDLTIEKQDDLLRFLTILYLTIADEDAAKDIISLIHLKQTCLDCIEVIRTENIGNKWIPVLMNQMQRCIDTDDTMRL